MAEKVSERMAFWTEQKKGANLLLSRYRPDYFERARDVGIEFLRFGPDLLDADEKDFLFGDLDDFKRLNENDLKVLRRILDDAYRCGVGIVLTMFQLPGQRYGNPNEDGIDGRLWQDEKYWVQAFSFWKQLALAVKDHPAIVAYNPLNEPVVTSAYGFGGPGKGFEGWLEGSKGTVADLNLFNALMVKAIREVDQSTPIMLDGYFWADLKGLLYTKPVPDPNVLYAFHNPAPWAFASLEGGQGLYAYPDAMPAKGGGPPARWTSADLERLIEPVRLFAEMNDISRYRIVASEFWCNRRIRGCAAYLADLIALYDRQGWHWGFWAYRGDGSYTGYDYELGDAPDSGLYIVKCARDDVDPESLKRRADNPIWGALSAGLRGLSAGGSGREESAAAIPEADIQLSISELRDEEWIVREAAARRLAQAGLRAYEAAPRLLELLGDEEWIVRRSAAYALGRIADSGDRGIVKKLKKLRRDPEEQVRFEANLALSFIAAK